LAISASKVILMAMGTFSPVALTTDIINIHGDHCADSVASYVARMEWIKG
jgi:hypothetical protein